MSTVLPVNDTDPCTSFSMTLPKTTVEHRAEASGNALLASMHTDERPQRVPAIGFAHDEDGIEHEPCTSTPSTAGFGT
jgi:hypothetical protein